MFIFSDHLDVTDLESADNLDAPFYEQEAFESIWDGLRWCHVRKRLPLCFKKTLHNRYMLANLIYLGYTIGLLIIDFNPSFYGASAVVDETSLPSTTTTAEPIPLLDQPVENNAHVNRLYIGQ